MRLKSKRLTMARFLTISFLTGVVLCTQVRSVSAKNLDLTYHDAEHLPAIPGGTPEQILQQLKDLDPAYKDLESNYVCNIDVTYMTPTPSPFPARYVAKKEGGPDIYGNTWYKKTTWTASNGVTLKIADNYSDVLQYLPMAASQNDIYYGDGAPFGWHERWPQMDHSGLFYPNTPEWWALKEYIYANAAYGSDYREHSGAFITQMPQVATVSTYQENISMSDDFEHYLDVASIYYAKYHNGFTSYYWSAWQKKYVCASSLWVNKNQAWLAFESVETGPAFEVLTQEDRKYIITIGRNPTPLDMEIFRTTLKRITPDAELVANEIIKQIYSDNPTFPTFNKWVQIGNQTKVAVGIQDINYDLQFAMKSKDVEPNEEKVSPDRWKWVDADYFEFSLNERNE